MLAENVLEPTAVRRRCASGAASAALLPAMPFTALPLADGVDACLDALDADAEARGTGGVDRSVTRVPGRALPPLSISCLIGRFRYIASPPER